MTTHTETLIINVPCDHIFELVADVERYPEFLPFWRKAHIYRHRGEAIYFTEQEIGLGLLQGYFRTRTELIRPSQIEVTSQDGLFRNFNILWKFGDTAKGCQVVISLTWEVRSLLMQRAIDFVLPETARKMVDAFENRACNQMRRANLDRRNKISPRSPS